MKLTLFTLFVVVGIVTASSLTSESKLTGADAECMLCNDGVQLLNYWITNDFTTLGLQTELDKLCALMLKNHPAALNSCTIAITDVWNLLAMDITRETCTLCHKINGCAANKGDALTKCVTPSPTFLARLSAKTEAAAATQEGLMCGMRDHMIQNMPSIILRSPFRDLCSSLSGDLKKSCELAFNTQPMQVIKMGQMAVMQIFKDAPLAGCKAQAPSSLMAPIASDLADGSQGCIWCWNGIDILNSLLNSTLIKTNLGNELAKVCDKLSNVQLQGACKADMKGTLDMIIGFIVQFTDKACPCKKPQPTKTAINSENPLSIVGCSMVKPIVDRIPGNFMFFAKMCESVPQADVKAECYKMFNTRPLTVINAMKTIYPKIFNLKC